MRQFKLCAAAMAMVITGTFAFPSQAGIGAMAIGGNCSFGQGNGMNGRTGNTGGWSYSANGNSRNTSGWNSGSNNSGYGANGWSNNANGNSCNTNGWSSSANGNSCNTNGWNNSSNNNCNTGNILPEIIFGNNWAGINGGTSSSCPIGTVISGSSNSDGNCNAGSNPWGNDDCLGTVCPEGTSPGQSRPNICIPGTDKPENRPSDEIKPTPGDPEETNPDSGNGTGTKPDTGNSGEGGSGGDHTAGGGSGSTRPGGSETGGNITGGDDLTQEGSQARTYIRQVIALVNEERAKAGLSPVTESGTVSAAAALRAQEITRSFSHTRPDGTSFSTALRQSGASFSGSGENIAYGQPSAQAVMDTWMNSSTHRANILNRQFTNIGVGCYIDSRGVIYWTQLFTY